MSELNDPQLLILSHASRRDNRAVLPLPEPLKEKNTASILKGLLRKKLVAERSAKAREPIWRESGDKRFTLVITDDGLDALGLPAHEESAPADQSAEHHTAAKSEKSATPSTKQATLIAMLQRLEGATLTDMVAATGWQPHSVRGVISGVLKKRLKLSVTSAHEERGRVYRIAGEKA